MSVALAQPHKPAPKPKPKASAEAPASAAPASEDSAGAIVPGSMAPAGASSLDAGAAAPPPAVRMDLGDGGVKLSPLNPAAPEMPPNQPPTTSNADYDRLLAEIAALRARVAAVGDSLFVARIVLAVQTDGSHARVGRMAVSLDDGVVYTAPQAFRADDPTTIYDHAVAPGRHAVTVDVDRRDDRDESFKDTEHARFVVDVPQDNRLFVVLRLGDDSNMGGSFASDRQGKYDLRIRMKATATPVNPVKK